MVDDQPICILGGTGFVGRHLASRLADGAQPIKVLTRRRARHRDLLVLPSLQLIEANIHDLDQLKTHFDGCGAVVNLVGILNEKGRAGSGFRHVHVELAEKVVRACIDCRVPRLLHMSALNADATSGPSHYLRTKGEAENYVLTASRETMGVTSFRPSVIFGPEDGFLNRFARLLRLIPFIFPLACPASRFAPVYVGDVTKALVNALGDKSARGQRYDLCGPREYTLKELVEYTARLTGRSRWVIGLPNWLSKLQAMVLEFVPGKPFSLDNYHSLSRDSVCGDHLRCPTSLESIAPIYLGTRHREHRLQQFRTTRAGR